LHLLCPREDRTGTGLVQAWDRTTKCKHATLIYDAWLARMILEMVWSCMLLWCRLQDSYAIHVKGMRGAWVAGEEGREEGS
jgi:hypothetical protein